MSLVEKMTALKANLLGLPTRFGMPQYAKHVYICKAFIQDGQFIPTIQWLLISPCKVEGVPARMIGLPYGNSTVLLSESDVLLKNIPRTYTYQDLTESVDFYAIGSVSPSNQDLILAQGGNALLAQGDSMAMSNSGLFDSVAQYSLAHISHHKTLSWEIILRKHTDRNPG